MLLTAGIARPQKQNAQKLARKMLFLKLLPVCFQLTKASAMDAERVLKLVLILQSVLWMAKQQNVIYALTIIFFSCALEPVLQTR